MSHALILFARSSIEERAYYVQRVRLVDADPTFAAEVQIVAWDERAGGPPSASREAPHHDIFVIFGGPALGGMTLSVLNLLLLQSRRIAVKRLSDADAREAGVDKLQFTYYVASIESLTGRAFELAMERDYPGNRGAHES